MRDLDGVILVGGPTRLPLVREAVAQYFQREPKTDVDPDQVVAMGAAIHAAALVGEEQETRLLDVTPLSLRIGVAGGLAETIIERNTPVPIEQTSVFTTFKDFQQSVRIRVYQGESRKAEENELLGEFEFSGFKNARRGEVRIEVTFEIDTDGIVKVTARDPDTAQVASTQIHLSSGLSEEEIRDLIDKHQAAPAPSAAPEPPMPAATLVAAAVAAAAAARRPALDRATRRSLRRAGRRAATRSSSTSTSSRPRPRARSRVPPTRTSSSTSSRTTSRCGDATASRRRRGFEREIELEGADDDDADPLDALDEADLDSLAALADDEALAAPRRRRRPKRSPSAARRPTDELFDAPGTDLSIFGDDEDDEV